jgi:SAM-dependent methyltransferase
VGQAGCRPDFSFDNVPEGAVVTLDAAHRTGTELIPAAYDNSGLSLSGMLRSRGKIDFHHGEMLALNEPDAAYAGVLAFYAIVHLEPAQLVTVFREMRRVLRPNGLSLRTEREPYAGAEHPSRRAYLFARKPA